MGKQFAVFIEWRGGAGRVFTPSTGRNLWSLKTAQRKAREHTYPNQRATVVPESELSKWVL